MATTTSIETYLAGVPAPARPQLDRLRAIVRSVVPDGVERISYQMPAIEHGRRIVVWYAAFADHVSLFPASDALKARFGDELRPYLSGRGTIRFPLDGDLPEDLIRGIVAARVAENEAANAARAAKSARRANA